MNFPTAVVVDRAGHLYIADTLNHRVRRVDAATGVITTVAGLGQPRCFGDGRLAVEAGLNEPAALAVSDEGRPLYCRPEQQPREGGGFGYRSDLYGRRDRNGCV